MGIFQKEINFDRFVRGLIFIVLLSALVMVVSYLGEVLLPFFLAWVLAYMLNPIVDFFQTKCRLRLRWLSVAVTLLLLLLIGTGVVWVVVPPAIDEARHLKQLIVDYLNHGTGNATIPEQVQAFFADYLQHEEVREFLNSNNVIEFVQRNLARLGNFIWHTANVLFSLFSWGITLLYLVFLLIDFQRVSTHWINYVPIKFRESAQTLSDDVAQGMSAYFRGQTLVALLVGVLFALGFTIIDLPMAIGFGLFVGVLNLVPYLQMLSLPLAVLLALLQAAESGDNFWVILLLVSVVYVVVQLIQDLYLVPKIMGRIMGLSPAIILLSLSIWGYILGFIGLIVALPLTTLILSYYRRYIIKETI